MTDQEKEALKAEIIEEITEKMKPVLLKEDTQSVLSEPRNKWFRSPNCNEDSPMFKLFGAYVYWQVWEHIRRLSCYICGKGYVRQLKECDHADDVAEQLCQIVYNLRLERSVNNAE